MRSQPVAAQSLQALTVSSNGERLAIPAEDITEVIRSPSVTRVPLSPPSLVGVSNLRGSVIPILSLATLMGQQQSEAAGLKVVIVDRGSPVGLLVDEVSSLKPSDQLRSGADPVRFLNLETLIAPEYGALTRPAASTAYAVTPAPVSTPAAVDTCRAYFAFEVGGQEFALPLENVREVLARPLGIAAVPRTDHAMVGLMNLRDRLLPLVSLKTLLGLGDGAADVGARIVVAVVGGANVGLIVEAVSAVIRAAPEDIDPVPLVLTRGLQEAQIQAICRLDGGSRLISILSTNHLLRDGLAERLLREQEHEADDMSDQANDGATEQLLIFQLGGDDFGLPVGDVSEVVAPPETLTRLPKAPAFVEGVMNLRGEVVPVIDQRRRFETSAAAARKPRVIVLKVGDGLAGFMVDGVSEVLTVAADQVRAAPDMASRQSKVIDRIANLEVDGRMILLINPQELLDRAEQDILAAMQEAASGAA